MIDPVTVTAGGIVIDNAVKTFNSERSIATQKELAKSSKQTEDKRYKHQEYLAKIGHSVSFAIASMNEQFQGNENKENRYLQKQLAEMDKKFKSDLAKKGMKFQAKENKKVRQHQLELSNKNEQLQKFLKSVDMAIHKSNLEFQAWLSDQQA